MSHPTSPREQFQEAVMCFRKAAYEFGLLNLAEDHATMLEWQRRIFQLYDEAARAGVPASWPPNWDGRDQAAFQRALGASQGATMNLPNIEIVSAEVHAAWMESKRAQGVTSRKAEDGEELMVPYDQLSEKAKELDRGTVRAVYAAIERAGGV